MTQSKTDIFHYLDRNGIKGDFATSYGFGFDMKTAEVETKFTSTFRLSPNPFGLSEKEFEAVIIDYIYETTNIRVDSLLNIKKYSSINGLPFIIQVFTENTTIPTFTLAFAKVNGTMILTEEDKFQSLGNIEVIEGDLKFKGSSIASLGKLSKVCGSIYIRQFDPPYTCLESLGVLEYVGGDLVLKKSPVTNLGKLRYVGGNLNLRGTRVSSLRELEYVGGNLFLPRNKLGSLDTSGVVVKGNLKYFSN
jgi:hypothetical protein